MECYKCGIFEDRAKMFDALSSRGIVTLCSKCFSGEDFPVIRRPTAFQLEESGGKPNVYKRLSRTPGMQETTLRGLIDKNYAEKTKKEKKPRLDLVENFHWVIMRERRARKLTQKQLADEIKESEAAIKMSEQGILPEDNNKLARKLESSLGIKLIKRDWQNREQIQVETVNMKYDKKIKEPTELELEKINSKNLTIADLKEIKKKRESKIFGTREITSVEKDVLEDDENLGEAIKKASEGKELTDEEIDDLIFGKKSK